MNLKFWGQNEFFENVQIIYQYSFQLIDYPIEVATFLEDFLHSKYFKEDCLPLIVKRDVEHKHNFLKRVFNEDKLSIKDFKIMSKVKLLQFFDEYSKEESWRDDRNDFVRLNKKFDDFLMKETCDTYFLLSKEWFPKNSIILDQFSVDIYIYYFLIIWIDEKEKLLTVCEWKYD